MSNTNVGRLIGGTTRTDGIQTLSNIHQTKMASVAWPISQYSEGGVAPALALDFIDGKYRLGKTAGSFSDAFIGNSPRLTYSTTSNSTMVNSAGNIVWAPHNLRRYSSDVSSWASKNNVTASSSSGNELGDIPTTLLTATSGLTVHRAFDVSLSETNPVTFSFYVKPGTFDYVQFHDGIAVNYWADFDLTGNGSVIRHTGFDATPTIEAVTSAGQTFFKITVQYTSTVTTILPIISFPDPSTVVSSGTRNPTWTAAGTETLYIGGVHLYRSNLGGMATVPGAATGFEYYVPTSSSAEYLPRVGHHVYNGSTWVNEGLLIESEARTNINTLSNDFDTAPWSLAGTLTSVTQNQTGPDGETSAWTMLCNTVNAGHYMYCSLTVGTGDHTYSVYLKYSNHQWATLRLREGGGTEVFANFDMLNGVKGSVTTGSTSSMVDVGNGWFRCSVNHNSTATAAQNAITVALNTSDTLSLPAWTPAGTEELYVYGAQLEQGSTPSSYMPTNGGTYTRTAQSLEVPAHWYDVDNPTYTGPELVVDGSGNWVGDFDVSADVSEWTDGSSAGGSIAWNASGYLDLVNSTGVARTNLAVATVVGETYVATVEKVAGSSGVNIGTAVGAGASNGDIYLGQNNAVDVSVPFVATSTTTYIGGYNSSTGTTASIDNISVRQVSAPQFGWPEPEYIGSELVTNGTFDTDTSGWTAAQGTISVVSGMKRLTNSGASFGYSYQAFATTVGAVYEVSGDIKMGTASGAYLRVGTTPTGVDLYNSGIVSADETKTALFVATSTTTYVHVINNNDADAYTDFDNISVREIHPLSVSIQMDGRMTYADEGVASNVTWWRWLANASDYVEAYYATDGAYDRSKFDQGTIVEQNTSNDSRYLFSPGINVPFNISSRHGSTFVNGAVDGAALPGDTTPTALPDLSATNLQIAQDFMGTVATFRQFAGDIGDAGLETSSDPGPSLSLTFDGSSTSSFLIN